MSDGGCLRTSSLGDLPAEGRQQFLDHEEAAQCSSHRVADLRRGPRHAEGGEGAARIDDLREAVVLVDAHPAPLQPCGLKPGLSCSMHFLR